MSHLSNRVATAATVAIACIAIACAVLATLAPVVEPEPYPSPSDQRHEPTPSRTLHSQAPLQPSSNPS